MNQIIVYNKKKKKKDRINIKKQSTSTKKGTCRRQCVRLSGKEMDNGK